MLKEGDPAVILTLRSLESSHLEMVQLKGWWSFAMVMLINIIIRIPAFIFPTVQYLSAFPCLLLCREQWDINIFSAAAGSLQGNIAGFPFTTPFPLQ